MKKTLGTSGEESSKLWKYTTVPEALENSQQRGNQKFVLLEGLLKCSEL